MTPSIVPHNQREKALPAGNALTTTANARARDCNCLSNSF